MSNNSYTQIFYGENKFLLDYTAVDYCYDWIQRNDSVASSITFVASNSQNAKTLFSKLKQNFENNNFFQVVDDNAARFFVRYKNSVKSIKVYALTDSYFSLVSKDDVIIYDTSIKLHNSQIKTNTWSTHRARALPKGKLNTVFMFWNATSNSIREEFSGTKNWALHFVGNQSGISIQPQVEEQQISMQNNDVPNQYSEQETLNQLAEYIKSTYGRHYQQTDDIQVLDLMQGAEGLHFCKWNVVKYLMRFGKKDGFNKKDLLKASHYLTLMMHFYKQMEKQDNDA